MTTPSLPQNDDAETQAQRSAALDQAKATYVWTHYHEYPNKQVLGPLALLEVDDEHPLPSSQRFDTVQIIDGLTIGVELLANVIVVIGNLLDIGAVEVDSSTPASGSGDKDDKNEVRGPGRLREKVEEIGKKVESVVEKGASRLGKVIGAAEKDGVEALFAKLHDHHRQGASLLNDALTALKSRDEDSLDKLLEDVGALVEDVLETLLSDLFEAVLEQAGLYGKAKELGDYAAQFQTIVVPNVLSTTMSDACFARMRIAGPNPLLITGITELPRNFPIDPARFEALAKQPLAEALASGRVYLVDWQALAKIVPGTEPAGQKYLSVPLALFTLGENRQRLSPIAIQLGQTPGNSTPVIYADDGQSWELAKLHAQSADGNYHEILSHLGLTHLLLEPFVVATHRNFAQTHPLFVLLLPHFQGTLFINNAAVGSLIAPGGTVDKLLAGTIESDWTVAATALAELDFNQHMLPNNLRARAVDDASNFPHYPYRDDALLLWAAIEGWVRNYLAIYYNDDADVANDTELQAWRADLVSAEGGLVKSLGEITTFAYLVEVVTMLIFTGSAQHASVNFPQLSVMSFTPAMPLATYAPAPTLTHAELPPDAVLDHLPPLQMGFLQLTIGQLLGGIYFTRLGEYDRHQQQPYFEDPRVREPLSSFQAELTTIELTIGARNLERPGYTHLLPSRIPQSINI